MHDRKHMPLLTADFNFQTVVYRTDPEAPEVLPIDVVICGFDEGDFAAMQPRHPQSRALEHIVAACRKRLEAAIARLPSGPERAGLREEVRQLDVARTRGRLSEMRNGVL